MNMEAVTVAGIRVEDVDPESLAGFGVEDAAWDPSVPRRFVDVCLHKFGCVGHEVVLVEILPVNEGVECRRGDLSWRHSTNLVPCAEHEVSSVVARAHNRRQGAVPGQRLDPQEDVATALVLASLPTRLPN
ncbi:hypothetical protein [Arthrobacter polaris]|uniref:hypothetical protein n=1 Tax=Arthrobacter polaris TaxID=2813727 RepID=UPI001F2B6251|nr:hypothetical protein [Arthrobacter polaris]